jgi:hypothetical protein
VAGHLGWQTRQDVLHIYIIKIRVFKAWDRCYDCVNIFARKTDEKLPSSSSSSSMDPPQAKPAGTG